METKDARIATLPWRLVVFDLDGTLIDAFADIAAAVNHMLALDGLPPRSVEEIKRHVGRGVRMLIAGVLGTQEEAIIDEKVKVLTEYYRQYPVRESKLYPGIAELLAFLDEGGVRLAVASNKPDALTQFLLRHFGVAERFDWILGQSDAFPRKPHPAILQHLMALAQAKPQETVVVGDGPTDVEFARAAGVPVICVTYGQCPREELEPHAPDAIVDSVAELRSCLANDQVCRPR